jgi:hypothetical protein
LINQCFENRYPLARNNVLGLTKKENIENSFIWNKI